MNTIEFKICERRDGDRILKVVSPVIDGADLQALAARVEQPFALAEGAPQMAGQYRGIWINYLAPPSCHLLGGPSHPVYQDGDKTQLLQCECGEPGCWPIFCRITVTHSLVVWSEFEQPHRRGDSDKKAWEYSGLGPFEFERKAYESALAALALESYF